MALPELHPVSEAVVFAHSAQIGATPAAAYARVPFRGKVLKVGVVQSGAVTGTGTVATAVNGNAIAGGSLSVTGGAAVKMAPITDLPFETVDSLIFDGLLALQSHRLAL